MVKEVCSPVSSTYFGSKVSGNLKGSSPGASASRWSRPPAERNRAEGLVFWGAFQ